MNDRNAVFFQVPQTRVLVSAGDVQLPILYYDASALYAFFLVEQEKIRELLLDAELEPGMRVGSKAIVGLACYQYRDTSVGVYNEVGLAIAVSRQDDSLSLGGWRDVLASFTHPEERRSGLYVLDLPVTTALANAAGREIWGFPKFVTPIEFELRGNQFSCSVENPDSGTPLMTLAGRSEEHTSELQSQSNLVCRLLLEKKKHTIRYDTNDSQFNTHTENATSLLLT